jgi:glycosyltransferase involved in cell wall biosynthesis
MKIALLAPVDEPVPPVKYGGTELVVHNLTEGLVHNGHTVTLVASGDSRTSAELHPVFPTAIRSIEGMHDAKLKEAYKDIGVARVVEYLIDHNYDVVHNHISAWRFLPFEHLVKAPVVHTIHGPLDTFYLQKLYTLYKDCAYTSISLSQRNPLPQLNYVANVYNGIETARFEYNPTPKDYFAFLGRMSPEKGPVQAIKIAKAAGVKLVMAAKVDAVDKTFFETEVNPLIDGEQIQFIGEVDHVGKVALLKNAQALLAPIQWDEPFGLFLVEALACGTPVITIKRGSVPELLEDNITAFFIQTVEEGAAAIKRIGLLHRSTCRSVAEERFDVKQMVKGYEEAYELVINNKKSANHTSYTHRLTEIPTTSHLD